MKINNMQDKNITQHLLNGFIARVKGKPPNTIMKTDEIIAASII